MLASRVLKRWLPPCAGTSQLHCSWTLQVQLVTTEAMAAAALKHIREQDAIAVDCEGCSLSKSGLLCLVQVICRWAATAARSCTICTLRHLWQPAWALQSAISGWHRLKLYYNGHAGVCPAQLLLCV